MGEPKVERVSVEYYFGSQKQTTDSIEVGKITRWMIIGSD
jgi:hypothetical protein